MCNRSEAMREVREAACKLSLVCLGIDVSLISDSRTLEMLPLPEEDFAALLAAIDNPPEPTDTLTRLLR